MNRKTHADPACYCEECCATASAWYEWRNGLEDGSSASGSRYWTIADAMLDIYAARADGLTILVHQPGLRVIGDVVSLTELVQE